jgi:hypothetical protein
VVVDILYSNYGAPDTLDPARRLKRQISRTELALRFGHYSSTTLSQLNAKRNTISLQSDANNIFNSSNLRTGFVFFLNNLIEAHIARRNAQGNES